MCIKRLWLCFAVLVGVAGFVCVHSGDTSAYQVTNIPIESRPTYTTVSPDGKKAYVSVWPGSNLYIFDTSNDSPPKVINLGFTPNQGEISPDGSRIYFPGYHSNQIRVFDTASGQIVSSISVPSSEIQNIALSSDGSELYVSQHDTDTTLVLNPITGAQIGSLNFSIAEMAFLPEGKAYATRSTGGLNLYMIDTVTKQITETIPFQDSYPVALGIDSSSSMLFVERHRSDGTGNILSVLDTVTNTVERDIPLGDYYSVSITNLPDGSYVYAPATGIGSGEGPGGGNFLQIVNTLTGEVSQLTVGYRPFDIEILPDGSKLYLANNGSANVSIIETGYEPVPEPATMLLLGSGLVGLAGFRRRFRKY